MNLPSKGKYSTIAILDLALHYGEGLILLGEIAARQQILERYLEQLVLSLKAGGPAKGIRGARGVCILAKSFPAIRLIDVIQTLGGYLCPVECVDDLVSYSCVDMCVTREI